jgi:hypothetical protein
MSKKETVVFIMALGLAQLSGQVNADPVRSASNFCTKKSGVITPGIVGHGQDKVIYGPYTVTCGTTSHHFRVMGASGQLPVQVQKFSGSTWSSVTASTYDPSGNYGAGIFRLVLNNRNNAYQVSYRGSFVVPM